MGPDAPVRWAIVGYLLMCLLSKPVALLAISAYQRLISPHKGWRCAYRALTAGQSCSMYARDVIRTHGFLLGALLLQERFDACAQASLAMRAKRAPDSCDQACEQTCQPCRQTWDDLIGKAKDEAERMAEDARRAAENAPREAFEWAKDALKDVFANIRQPDIELEAPWEGEATITQGNDCKISHHGRFLYALDFGKFPSGREVLAAAKGTVAHITLDPKPSKTPGGTTVILKHSTRAGGTVYTVYAHLSEVLVSDKDKEEVEQGQVIAESGDTGTRVVGPHLHFHVCSKLGGPTVPINALHLKLKGQAEFKWYYSDTGDLNHDRIVDNKDVAQRTFESSNVRLPRRQVGR